MEPDVQASQWVWPKTECGLKVGVTAPVKEPHFKFPGSAPDLLQPSLAEQVEEKQLQQKMQHDATARSRTFNMEIHCLLRISVMVV